ncbi:uncharacterized protein J7T54_001144 [Emericellopsis cladophorae]|uniref:Uncharacterized protein n=1 Tax=Emericellopsis cladophorae TaxID=2686198 RepID=A0A9P9XZP5_9HYPO|nr:uncharacterized protein J7T54_001144 [Emericellopsis cladophorae]KAI6780640.1 hypothetical protein J7T54_001144 [Emericellopsis cladophorae]
MNRAATARNKHLKGVHGPSHAIAMDPAARRTSPFDRLSGARIRETQQNEHIAWPSGNEELRNELLSQPEHHQLAQNWETNIATWRRMCLQIADFPPYHRAIATGEDWIKVTALPQWLAAFRANLIDYTDAERLELSKNSDVKWLSYPKDNDFNRFIMESPCGTTFVIDNELESDVTHTRGDEAARTELSMAEPAVHVGPTSQISQYIFPTSGHESLTDGDECSFKIEIHKGDEDEDQHGEPLLPYVLNNCRLYGEDTGVGQAWLFVLRNLYASGSLDTEITALREEAGLVLDMYQQAADTKQETRAGELYDEACTIAKYLQKYRERNSQHQLDTESCVPERIYGPTAMGIRRPRINRAMERHARLLGVDKAYLKLPPKELYVDMLNNPNTRVLSIEEIIDGHLVRPWRDISRAPSLDERELNNKNCLDAVRPPQNAEFKIRGAALSNQKVHHGNLVGGSVPAVLSGTTSHAAVHDMAHTTDQQDTNAVDEDELSDYKSGGENSDELDESMDAVSKANKA